MAQGRVKHEALKTLYDDPGPFASAYVEVSRDAEAGNRIVDLTAKAVAEDLTAQGAPDELVTTVRERLEASTHLPAPTTRCVVVSERGVLIDALVPTRRAQAVATWGPLPDVAAWLTDTGQRIPFVLALVNHEGGDVTSYAADGIAIVDDSTVGTSTPLEHKTGGGGWSQYRWERAAEGVWKRNATEVAAEIERQVQIGPELVLLAGEDRSVELVRAELPASFSAEVVDLPTGSRAVDGGDDALAAAVSEALSARVVAAGLARAHELRDRMGQGRGFAAGVRDVADALVRGQVDTLLLDPDQLAEQALRPADHPGIGLEQAGEDVRADQALVALAVRTDADVYGASAATMGGSPVAALLRWDQTAEGSSLG